MPFLMSEEEVELLTRYIKCEFSVLEVGSGESTIEFAKQVKKVISLEHNEKWYRKISKRLKKFNNVKYTLIKPNKMWKKYVTDGNYESFKDYIDFLSSLKEEHFDLIFVDGRARKDCLLAIGSHHPNALFFLHDFYINEEKLKKNKVRTEYLDLLDEFELVELKGSLALLKVKKVQS